MVGVGVFPEDSRNYMIIQRIPMRRIRSSIERDGSQRDVEVAKRTPH
jgi:hypothetical protein